MPEPADMPSVCVYLTFSGNCREAMTFYQQCLGGTLSFATLNETSQGQQLHATEGKYILLAQLKHSMITLMATDIVPEEGLVYGNAVSLYLNCRSKKQMEQLYASLSEGGIQTHPLHQTFFGEWFANLTDAFGIHWLLYYASSQQ